MYEGIRRFSLPSNQNLFCIRNKPAMKTERGNYFVLALAVLALNFSVIQEAIAASWFTNSPLTTARYLHTATLLPNGKVLFAGGRAQAVIFPTRSCTIRSPG